MSVLDILEEFKKLNVVPRLDGDQLKLHGDTHKLHADFIRRVTDAKAALIAFLQGNGELEGTVIPALPPAASYPASNSQKRLWLLSRLEGGAAAYNIITALRVRGTLLKERLEAAFRSSIERHESLRTVFRLVDGELHQVMADEFHFEINYDDISGAGVDERLHAAVQACTHQVFDLGRELPLRVHLYKIAEDDHALVLNLHHIVADGWSVPVLLREVMAGYDAMVRGKEMVLAPLRIQYKDYAAWMETRMDAARSADDRAFWRSEFEVKPEPLNLPYDFVRPAQQSFEGAVSKVFFDAALCADITKYCRTQGVTLFNFLRSVLTVLLHKFSGENDSTIGTPVAGRGHRELEGQVGFYVNTLPLRFSVDALLSFDEFVQRVAAHSRAVFSHQDYGFERIVEEAGGPRDGGRNPLFDVVMALQDVAAGDGLSAGGLELSRLDGGLERANVFAKFDLDFNFGAEGDRYYLELEYATRLFTKERIDQLINAFIYIMEQVLESPSVGLDKIRVVDAKGEKDILAQQDSTTGYPREATLVSLFEEQAARTPNNIAVVCEDASLTYAQLNAQSNQLAHYLRKNYLVESDTLIGIQLERGVEMIVAIIAILKAGGAYVPIDPAYPQERIDYMIEDSNCAALIDDEELRKFYSEQDQYSTANPEHINNPSDLAYVIYTSGTTGKPKGSLIEHRNVVRLLVNDAPLFDFNERDVWTMFHSYCFDFSVWEMYGALLFGGKLVVIPVLTAKDPAAYREVLKKQGVTVLNQTPSAFYNLIKEEFEQEDAVLKLRYVIFGGEALSPGKLAAWHERYPSTQLINMYGITETTVHVTYKKIGEEEIRTNSSNIGKPIPTLSCYVLDTYGQLAPIGVAGELYVGGEGVCRGYLNRPELTEKKFIQSPFKQGERLYRSGDKARLLPNGELEYGGRIDDQVKIRGYRIELGEVENALRRNDKVEDVVILARKEGNGETSLVAYLTSNEELNTTDLRLELAEHLPAYMLPSYYVQLDSFPLTSNGKVNKKALPEPESGNMDSGVEYVAPGTQTEEKLVAIWQELLGKDRIGIKDNFFDLGGHSLRVISLMGRIHKAFEVKVDIKDLFARAVLEEQAALIESAATAGFSGIEPVAEQNDYALSPAQRRLWILGQLEQGNEAYNIPAAYIFEGDFQEDALAAAFAQLLDRHESLRTVFRTNARGEARQVILTAESLRFSLDTQGLRGASEETLKARVESEFIRPFDLAVGPLLRAGVYRIGEVQWLFTCVLHHIITDGLSMSILIRELLGFYNSFTNGEAHTLSPLRIHYKDYAAWLDTQQHQAAYQGHKDYWLGQFAGELPVLDLPVDKPRPAVKTYNGATVSEVLQAPLCAGLRQLCADAGGTLFMGLQALVNTVLYRYTGQQDMITGTQIAGRDHADLDDQIGLYLNTLALRMRVEGNESFRELLQSVRAATLAAYEHQAYPFDELVDALDLQRDASRNPLFDVSVVLQNAALETLLEEQSTGFAIRRYEALQNAISKFDLAFDFVETGEEIQARLVYNTDIYTAASAARMLRHFNQLAAALIAVPDAAIAQVNYLSADEQEQIVKEFNDTQVAYPSDRSIAELFEAQAMATPSKPALVFGDKKLTYKELNQQANKLAAYLRSEYKVQPNDKVAIMLDRSEALPVAILGVLKSGAAYVPIDVDYPAARKSFILQDTSAQVLITQSDYLFELDYFSGNLFAIDVQLDGLEEAGTLENVSKSTDLAYVMYTSGSTGNPKGVLIEQRSVVRLVKSSTWLSFSGEEVILSTGAISFDATTFEYWASLLNGGTLVLCTKDTLLDEQKLARQIRTNHVDTMWFTAGWFNQLVDKDVSVFQGLKTIVAGGDKLSLQHIQSLRSVYPDVRIINGYGPTENTTFSLTYTIGDNLESIPVGKPISNSTAYILDAQSNLCPIGVAGEICVGGDGLARGYLNNEELTAQKFITHPVVGRIYKTGDLGRWLEDGNIEFLGRKDEQVKVRGYRIELGEIENALQAHDQVEAAVVITRADTVGEKQIIAYLVSPETLAASDLRAFLSKQLPTYMLPDQFVQLDELPLTANGKVDRKALPQPEGLGMESGAEYVAPRTETEIKLAAIWSEILNKETISARDNFFEIGGHSLKATRLASQIHREFDVKVELKDIFTKTILEEQAQLIDGALKNSFVAIQPIEEANDYALSSSQRRLWAHSQIEDVNLTYNIPVAYTFEGNFDIQAFAQAFDSLIERHEILRTVFREDSNGIVRQHIKPASDHGFHIETEDLRATPHSEAELVARVRHESTQPFDLSAGPLLRARLYQMADNRWVLTYVMHHIISDGWSMGVLMKELFHFYNARTNGQAHTLSPLRIQYKDYAAWQQQQLGSPAMQEQKDYWLGQFTGHLPVLQLPADHERPAIQSQKGSVVVKQLDAALVKALKALGQQEGGTLFMSLLAGVNALLYRYTGQQDIIIGTPIAAREHADLHDQIGYYLNTLALRTRLSSGDSFSNLLSQVRDVTLAAYKHQAYPFDELVEALELRRDLGRSLLFDVMILLQNFDGSASDFEQDFDGVSVRRYREAGQVVSKYDLTFYFTETGDTIRMDIEYNTDIFERATIVRMGDHLNALLASIAADPGASVDSLDYLPSVERASVVEGFNDTRHDYPKDKTLNGLFEEQAALRPDAVALIFEDKSYTYSEINAHANRLAHYLRSQYNLKADDVVVIQLERSEWMIISLLAVLKAGAAYVPVDPQYPEERIQYMIDDSGRKATINDEELQNFFQQQAQYGTDNIDSINGPTDLAYVIYTSGSTGKPKGCLLQHQGVINRLEWMWTHYGFSPEDVILQKTTFTFDVSVWELFLPLCWGAKMVLCQREDIAAPERIAQLIERHGVTCLHFVPGMLQAFISSQFEEKDIADRLQSLRRVITSGEALLPATVQSWYKTMATPLHNLYGPTEASVDVTYYATQPNDTLVPIGRPIWNTQIYITDKQGQPVGIGVVGGINLAGDGLARGYLNRPELTEQKFVANPFNPGTKMYRTGDVGRWLSDGNIEFLGRSDDQVKIRGYRIELGEIETALLQHEAVKAAAVLALSDSSNEKTLVAYVITEANAVDLRSYLGQTLPVYMVPQHFVVVDSMPLTASGKVDRKALAATTLSELKSETEYIAPRTDVEHKLAQIWQDILGREHIGVKDSFFDLGGHSLKATRLASQVYKTFNVRVALKDLFMHVRLEDLALFIESAQTTTYTAIQPVAPADDYELSSAQRRLWVLSQFEETSAAYNMPAVYRFEGRLDNEAHDRAFNTLIERHESLRTTFHADASGSVRQRIHPAGAFTISRHDLRNEDQPEARAKEIAIQESLHPFDLAAGPLLRVTLCRLAGNQWLFIYVMHHIVSDGWSMGILVKELLGFYTSLTNGEAHTLSPLRIHYKDYAAWQNSQGAALQQHKAYWLQQLSGELPVLELPGDKARPAVKTYNGGVVSRTIGASLATGLKALGQQEGGTLFMTLLAGVNALLHRYTGQEDFIIGSPIAGRQHADLENQIGFYLNTLALRTQFSGDASFRALVRSVRKMTLEAYEHQLYPFDELVNDLDLPRNLSRSPLFDVMVILQNTDNHTVDGTHGELTIKPWHSEQLITKFDLLFNFAESNEGIRLDLEYNSDIYERATAERLCRHLEHILSAAAAQPSAAIDALDYLDAEERRQVLETFNDTAAAFPDDTTLTALFETQAQEKSDAIALVFDKKEFSFRELNERSNQLAHYLRKTYRIKPDDIIAVRLERSEWMIISILAVLKSGAAYLPIDPEYPQERIDYIIEDSRCKAVIDGAEFEHFLKEEVLHLKKDPLPIADARSLAYVIYTSGSTGKPKGCMLEHRGAVNRIDWMWHHYGFDATDVILQKTTFTFDVSVWEIFLPLCWGAKMVLCQRDDVHAPDRIVSLIEQQHITCLHFVPGMLNAFLAMMPAAENIKDRLQSLRRVITSGEALAPGTVNNWYQLLDTPIHNLYGPTEASVDVTYYATQPGDTVIPIGRPIWNTQMYVLGKTAELLPVGAIGEICIGGDGLARGYLNREELTAEKFIANPYKYGSRIYRTGDLGRWLPDGNIEYLGRKDDQVKVRGFRIELGEIENALLQHEAIDAAAVLARTDRRGEKELAAYIVSRSTLSAAALRTWLGGQLPAYMVPAHFVQLETMPLTPNGKTDRKRLPAPEGAGLASGAEYVAPVNEVEERMANLWQEVLGRERIGTRDNFFDLGGHSLKALLLAGLLQKEFSISLTVKDVFLHPTIEALANLVRVNQWVDVAKNNSKENRNIVEV